MTQASNLYIYEVEGWCAGGKVSITNNDIGPDLKWTGIARRVAEIGGCVAIVSVNVEEVEVIKWLEDNKFQKSPEFRNYHHGGRKTLLYMKQVTKTTFEKYY